MSTPFDVISAVPTINTVKTIMVANNYPVLAADYEPLLPLNPHPVLLRAYYIAPGIDLDDGVSVGRTFLDNPTTHLLAPIPPQPPMREMGARIFVWKGKRTVVSPRNSKNLEMREYYCPDRNAGHEWISNSQQGTAGYFLTGYSRANLWHIDRIDVTGYDNSVMLILSLASPSYGFPSLNLQSIPIPLIQAEIKSHYEELKKAIASISSKSVATHARSIAEAVVRHLLEQNGQSYKGEFSKNLTTISELRIKNKAELPWISDLAYHGAQRIRLMHARTHVARAVRVGQSLDSELAASCVEDLKQLLREARLLA